MIDWKKEIDNWISLKVENFQTVRKDFYSLFEKAFENTVFPEKVWFGIPPSKNSLSLSLGSVFLLGSVRDGAIWILVDCDLSDVVPYRCEIVKSSIHSGTNLFWIEARNENVKEISNNQLIWEHYRIASAKVLRAPQSSAERESVKKGKTRLSDFWKDYTSTINYELSEKVFEREVSKSRKEKSEERRIRIKKASKIPIMVESKSISFVRNPDIVAETLENSKGICAYCGNHAPFNRDSDETPYLEVHHIIPLSEGGEDSIENSVALCPNCHRQAHFGKLNFNIDKIKK